jgi:CO/xanthine dehydrogenase Mo-binding subunit
MSENLRVVNKNVHRVDAAAKVTGSARYTVDMKLPSMLHCRMVRSPHPFARVKAIDVTAAESLPGVMGIVTHLDLVKANVRVQQEKLDGCVRFTGEPVVAVAAETERKAEEAARRVKVEYEILKPVRNMDEAMDPNGPRVWPGGNGLTRQGPAPVTGPALALWNKGDVKKGLEEADASVDVDVITGGQAHVAFEPHAVLASWDRGRRELNLWISTQQIHEDQYSLAQALGINAEQVHVNCTYCGGAYGGKLETFKEAFLVSFLSRKTARPVRFVQSREEEAATTACRLPARFKWRLGARKDGKLTTIHVKNLTPCGPFASRNASFIMGRTDFVAPSYFTSENCGYEGRGVYTNNMPTAAYRGFGYFESATALGIAVDSLCEKLEMDPYAFHMMNMPDYGSKIGVEQGLFTVKGLKEALTACVNEAGWKEKRHKPGKNILPDGRLHGIGLGFGMGRTCLPEGFGSGGAMIKIGSDGKAKVFAGISDMGQGQATGCAQIAAEALGMNMEDVAIIWGDTIAPKTNFQAASATTMMTGNAVKEAGEEVRKKAWNGAAKVLRVSPEDLTLKDGVFESKSTGKKISYSALVRGFMNLYGTGNWYNSLSQYYPRAPMFTVIEVAVDPETGLVEITNLVQATDCGRAVSRSRVEGQMQGVLSGGVGFLLVEGVSIDESRMRILNANMSDYKIFTSLDPHIEVMKTIIVEKPDEIGPFGARGMGEAVHSASGAALANAVYNAIGVRMYETPFSPGKILAALGSVKGGKA